MNGYLIPCFFNGSRFKERVFQSYTTAGIAIARPSRFRSRGYLLAQDQARFIAWTRHDD
jgi:hypothetical protein